MRVFRFRNRFSAFRKVVFCCQNIIKKEIVIMSIQMVMKWDKLHGDLKKLVDW